MFLKFDVIIKLKIMKKLFFLSAIIMLSGSLCLYSQSTRTKLNQAELSKKLIGVWNKQTASDTVQSYEMSLYRNAVLETVYQTVKGVKELSGTIIFTYDAEQDKFKGLWIHPDGKQDSFFYKFVSDKEVVFEMVDDFRTNKLLAKNKMTFIDENHVNGSHYNGEGVQYGSSVWVRTK